ncbi:uncharacterized protein DUF3152 [Branchiibius hedensis]|uniref:DUF3152 domain-containing protein n=1 Tax=Branchiibius hedensis TaxID=672460 RepID=A0A2Y8ZRX9_9MICO|nr:DUF3152 domain-containing protein [Branchiibius hedensis]PWJ25861.1 uncharacterized protein DUF3152 [Branchiibius hedensis]SSA34674.1 Protein of unknown function [Branchiibius hedensis]
MRRRRTIAAAVVGVVGVSALAGFLHESGGDVPSARPTASASSSTVAATTTTTPVASPSSTPVVVPTRGTGTFTTVTVPQTTTATSGREITYILQIENGLGADNATIAKTVGADLLNARGWQGVDHVRFVQLTAAELAKGRKPILAITLASPDTVNKLCAPLDTHGEWSCGNNGRATLNYERWMLGVPYFGKDLAAYHAYMVNHEVGHILGHPHQHCAKAGDYAPVMQQQSMGLQGCKAWPWPQRPAAG